VGFCGDLWAFVGLDCCGKLSIFVALIILIKMPGKIINRASGDKLEIEFHLATKTELSKLKGWRFDWKKEYQNNDIYKMVIKGNKNIIQGLIALQDLQGFIYVSLVETAPFNMGVQGLYKGVGPGLFALACKLSFDKGYDGYVSFQAKTDLIDHYQKALGAIRLTATRMVIEPDAALNLVQQYF